MTYEIMLSKKEANPEFNPGCVAMPYDVLDKDVSAFKSASTGVLSVTVHDVVSWEIKRIKKGEIDTGEKYKYRLLVLRLKDGRRLDFEMFGSVECDL